MGNVESAPEADTATAGSSGSRTVGSRGARSRSASHAIKPFLLLAHRPEDVAADGEYEAILRFGGLAPSELVRVRLEEDRLGPIDLDDFSGIIVGGGPFNTSDDDAAKTPTQLRVEGELNTLLAQAIRRDFPYLGLCYGAGVLAQHIGATIDHQFGEEAGPVPITLTPSGVADPIFAGSPHHFPALVGHKEAISRLPGQAELLASSPDTPVQAFRVGENVYGVQYHPELDVPGILERIQVYRDFGYFNADEIEAVKERAASQTITDSHHVIENFVAQYARSAAESSQRAAVEQGNAAVVGNGAAAE